MCRSCKVYLKIDFSFDICLFKRNRKSTTVAVCSKIARAHMRYIVPCSTRLGQYSDNCQMGDVTIARTLYTIAFLTIIFIYIVSPSVRIILLPVCK